MITSHIFIRCIIARASITKKHKEPNFLGCWRAGPPRRPGAAGVWGAGVCCWRWGSSPGPSRDASPAVESTTPSSCPGARLQPQRQRCRQRWEAKKTPLASPRRRLHTACQRMMQRDPEPGGSLSGLGRALGKAAPKGLEGSGQASLQRDSR